MKPIIGLEIHIELATNSKMFCACSATHFNVEPNTHCCPVCLGLPGALPVPNKKAVDDTIILGLALNCEIAKESKFDRKNYFYPDLPKGYQISQYDQPLCYQGKLVLSNGKIIRIRRVHLEEDTGKLIHKKNFTLIDFNRSGVPLVEVVTEPDFDNSAEVDEFLKKLQLIVRHLKISSVDMEKGSMRLEPNISVQKPGQTALPDYKVEVKNINSFRFARKAIDYEIKRQTQLLEKGQTPIQETRGWKEAQDKTVSQREKEQAHDYRYFPEPDIPAMTFNKEEIAEIKSWLPELPDAKIERFVKDYGLSKYNAQLLIDNWKTAEYFEKAAALGIRSQKLEVKDVANWIINKKIDIEKITIENLIETIANSKKVFAISQEDLEKAIKEVIDENEKAVADYKNGKTQILGFLIGQVVRKTNPAIDKTLVQTTLVQHLT